MVLTDALISAAQNGDATTIKAWLAAGGDPDEPRGPNVRGEGGETLLHVVAGYGDQLTENQLCGRIAIARELLARGATVDALRDKPKNTPLISAVIHGRVAMVQLLCQAGANVHHRRGRTELPLWLALERPSVVRVLLRFGADPSIEGPDLCFRRSGITQEIITVEEKLLREAREWPWLRRDLAETRRLLANARLLRPRLQNVFLVRALLIRGRAAPTSGTPEVFARLIGGGSAPSPTTSRPRTRTAKLKSLLGLPDPLLHLVCTFWLGVPARPCRRPSES